MSPGFHLVKSLLFIYESLLDIFLGSIAGVVLGLALISTILCSPLLAILSWFGVRSNASTSPTSRLEPKDHTTLQAYLDHFTQLYPALIHACALASRRPHQTGTFVESKWWPVKQDTTVGAEPDLLSVEFFVKSTYTHTLATGLFLRLNEAGWSRQILLEFLRDKVEQSGLASQEEREAFRDLMERMFSSPEKDYWRWINSLYISHKYPPSQRNEVPSGEHAYYVQSDSLEWLLNKGLFLVPEDRKMYRQMRKLASTLPMWRVMKKDKDIENGRGLESYWQMMDLRSV